MKARVLHNGVDSGQAGRIIFERYPGGVACDIWHLSVYGVCQFI